MNAKNQCSSKYFEKCKWLSGCVWVCLVCYHFSVSHRVLLVNLKSVQASVREDRPGTSARENHCKSSCLTCPQSDRKVLIWDGSTSAALWSVMSGIISWVSLPPEDLLDEWGDKRSLEANSVCVFYVYLVFWYDEILLLMCWCVSISPKDVRNVRQERYEKRINTGTMSIRCSFVFCIFLLCIFKMTNIICIDQK